MKSIEISILIYVLTTILTPTHMILFIAWKVSRIFPHLDWIRSISSYSVQMWENTDQKNSEYGLFLRSDCIAKITEIERIIVILHSIFLSPISELYDSVAKLLLLFFVQISFNSHMIPANIYLFKVTNRSIRKTCEICSKLTIKTPEPSQWRPSGVFIVNFEHISHLFLGLLLVTLNK